MPAGSALLGVVMGAAAPAAPVTTTAEERNVSLWAGQASGLPLDLQDLGKPLASGTPHLPPLVEGPLNYDDRSPVAEPAGKRSRVHAILGVGATLDGLGAIISMLYDRVPGAAYPHIQGRTVALALAAFLRDVLPAPLAGVWQAGLRVPLPIEIDATVPATPKLVLNGDKLLAWASLPYATALATSELTRPAAPLEIPAPDGAGGLIAKVTAELAAAPDPTTLAPAWATELLRNPYRPVFELIEILTQLRAADAAAGTAAAACKELALALALGAQPGLRKADGQDPLRVVGWTSGGQAVLRILWTRLGEGSSAPLDAAHRQALTDFQGRLADALDLTVNGGVPVGPPDWGPGTKAARAEPPLTPALAKLDKAKATALSTALGPAWSGPENEPGAHAMALGRYLRVGPIANDNPPWFGPAFVGGLSVNAFWALHPDTLGNPIPPKTEAARRILFAISPNEGKLDASRAADHGLLSTGIQQWTIDNNTELTVMLEKFKAMAPYQFDLHFRLHGLDTRVWGGAGSWDGKDATLNPTPGSTDEQKIKDCNVYWLGGTVSELGLSFPTYVTLDRIEPGAQRVPMPVDPSYATKASTPDANLVRFHFFGGKRTVSGGKVKRVDFAPDWCARVRLAALTSVPYNQAQIMLAAFRMQRMVNEGTKATVFGAIPSQRPKTAARKTWLLTELCSSEWAAAIALDQHINWPAAYRTDPQTAVDRALAQAVAAYVQDAGGASTDALDPLWQQRFIVDYLAVRRTFGKAARDRLLLALHDKELNALLGTAVYPHDDGPPKKAT